MADRIDETPLTDGEKCLAAFAVAERAHNDMAALVNAAKRSGIQTVTVKTLDLNALMHVMAAMNDALVQVMGQGWIFAYAEQVDRQQGAKPEDGHVH